MNIQGNLNNLTRQLISTADEAIFLKEMAKTWNAIYFIHLGDSGKCIIMIIFNDILWTCFYFCIQQHPNSAF